MALMLAPSAAHAEEITQTGLELLEPIPDETYDPTWVWMVMHIGEFAVVAGIALMMIFVIGRDGVTAQRNQRWERRL